VQASFEAFQDIAGLQSDVMMLFADARDRLEGAAHATGSGSAQPKGIVTALDASTSVEITSTTAATIGEVDVHALYRGVPIRWRGNGQWLMNPLYNLAIKRLGSAVGSAFTGYLTAPTADQILGRPVVESDDMPTTQTTTALDNEIVYGDFSNYVIVDKPGSTSVEFIPNMFNTSNNLPDARRAWFMWFRSGADASNISAFRLLQDKTSA
jgi:HK97 family phage major capsid protein